MHDGKLIFKAFSYSVVAGLLILLIYFKYRL